MAVKILFTAENCLTDFTGSLSLCFFFLQYSMVMLISTYENCPKSVSFHLFYYFVKNSKY